MATYTEKSYDLRGYNNSGRFSGRADSIPALLLHFRENNDKVPMGFVMLVVRVDTTQNFNDAHMFVSSETSERTVAYILDGSVTYLDESEKPEIAIKL